MLNSKCDVFTVTTSRDAMAGLTETAAGTARLLDEPCRIRELSSTERVVIGREGVVSTHRMYFNKGTVLNANDRIKNIKTLRRGAVIATDTSSYDVGSRANDVDRMQRLVQVDVILRK